MENTGRQLLNLGFLQEKANPGGFGSLTALTGKNTKVIFCGTFYM